MIHSKYISDIVYLLTEAENEQTKIRTQIKHLEDSEYEYTGVGLFVTFSHSNEILPYKLNRKKAILNNIEIHSNELKIGANASLFITDGIIDFLEIFSFDAVYPKKEIHNYTLDHLISSLSEYFIAH